ncbi:CTP synthetase [Halorubrum sp. JWXQ-INN 858]|uniref:DUF7126 family protein n=1 Tax=Halorubrum sp. JWXQ-INN 858 TaxID=2690782 RepID=UPI001F30B7DE|nr:CTP synthetase [Halorubrum sp. JWXQ-INN 858]
MSDQDTERKADQDAERDDEDDAVRAIVVGPDEHGLGEELIALDAVVTRIEGVVATEALRAAGIEDADYLVVTDVEEATGIPVAKERNPDVVAVTYAERSLPAFVAAVADVAMDPALLSAAAVAEELAGGNDDDR